MFIKIRKAALTALVLIIFTCGISEARSVFTSFPADGICTGDYVRYRSRPSTNAKILGRLFDGDEVRVVSERSVNGQVWYEIYDPNSGDRTVWVAGRYIIPVE